MSGLNTVCDFKTLRCLCERTGSDFFLRQYELHQVQRVTSQSRYHRDAPKVFVKDNKINIVNDVTIKEVCCLVNKTN